MTGITRITNKQRIYHNESEESSARLIGNEPDISELSVAYYMAPSKPKLFEVSSKQIMMRHESNIDTRAATESGLNKDSCSVSRNSGVKTATAMGLHYGASRSSKLSRHDPDQKVQVDSYARALGDKQYGNFFRHKPLADLIKDDRSMERLLSANSRHQKNNSGDRYSGFGTAQRPTLLRPQSAVSASHFATDRRKTIQQNDLYSSNLMNKSHH